MTPTPCSHHVGFLLPHPCPSASIGSCVKCARPACERHAALSPAGLLCKACETGSDAPPLVDGALRAAGLVGAVAAAGGLAALAAPLFLPQDVAAFEAAGLEDEGDEDRFADLS